jgi:hypothetical protein
MEVKLFMAARLPLVTGAGAGPLMKPPRANPVCILWLKPVKPVDISDIKACRDLTQRKIKVYQLSGIRQAGARTILIAGTRNFLLTMIYS